MAFDGRETDTADMNRYDDSDLLGEEPEGDEPEPAEGEGDEPEEDDLSGLDEPARARAEAYAARHVERLRAGLQEAGLDLNQDGRPLIADWQKVQQWGGVGVASPRTTEVSPAAPPAAPAPPPAEEPEAFDPLAADAEDYERFTQRVAEKAVQSATGPLLEEIQRLRGMSQQRAENEATSRVRQVVEARAPEMVGALDHPDFGALYRQEIAKVGAEYLADDATVGALAALVRMRLDPSRMPARPSTRENPAAASLALNQANRASLGQTAPSRQGGTGTDRTGGGRSAEDEWGVRFLSRMKENMSDRAAARVEVSPEAWAELGIDNLDDYKRAKAERLARQNRSGQRSRR